MTRGEEQALATIKEHFPNVEPYEMVKKLGEKLVELAMAVQSGLEDDVKEEIGDCAYILLHLLSKCENQGLITEIVKASEKLERRVASGHYKAIR